MKIMQILSSSVEETRAAGSRLLKSAKPGDIYALVGELGTGKTEFVRGFVEVLRSSTQVRSPTFTIVNVYDTPSYPVYHFDFYRLKKAEELVEIGFNDYIQGDGVCFIEWADMFPEVLPRFTRFARFSDSGNGQRSISIED
jgi:tRNA threonylcarbamoyladenosine biosynthesis protein TsaE